MLLLGRWFPNVDWEYEALNHYASSGLDVPLFKRRLGCCLVHIGLESQTYNVFKERWPFVDEVAERTLAFASAY